MRNDQQPSEEAAPHLSTDEARAGATPHMTRYVLGWGLVLVVAAFAAVLAFYMLRT